MLTLMVKLMQRDPAPAPKPVMQHLQELHQILLEPLSAAEKDEAVIIRQNATGSAWTIHSTLFFCDSIAKELSLVLDRDFLEHMPGLERCNIRANGGRSEDFALAWGAGGEPDSAETILNSFCETQSIWTPGVEEQGKIRLMQQLANGVDSASCMGTGFPNPRNKSAYLIGEKARLLKAVNVLHGFTREKSFNPRFVGGGLFSRSANTVLHYLINGGLKSRYLCDSYNMLLKQCRKESVLVPTAEVRKYTMKLVQETCQEWCEQEWQDMQGSTAQQLCTQALVGDLIHEWFANVIPSVDSSTISRMYWEDVLFSMLVGLLAGVAVAGHRKLPHKSQNFMGLWMEVRRDEISSGSMRYTMTAKTPPATGRNGKFTWGHDLAGHMMPNSEELCTRTFLEDSHSRIVSNMSFLQSWLQNRLQLTVEYFSCSRQLWVGSDSRASPHNQASGTEVTLSVLERKSSEEGAAPVESAPALETTCHSSPKAVNGNEGMLLELSHKPATANERDAHVMTSVAAAEQAHRAAETEAPSVGDVFSRSVR
uniref:Uncharacterized protein n=1 Tax=Tetraselmis chuii TaxID=63592 RepID=A0A7S1SQ31_9CHLO